VLIPGKRVRYLAEIAEQGRGINRRKPVLHWAEEARRAQHYWEVLRELEPELDAEALELLSKLPETIGKTDDGAMAPDALRLTLVRSTAAERYNEAVKSIPEQARDLLRGWPDLKASVEADEYSYEVRGKTIKGSNYRESLSRLQIPRSPRRRHRLG
jgi:isobutyryl-CoA mutase